MIKTLNEYTQQEVDEMWMTPLEQQQNRNALKEEIKFMMACQQTGRPFVEDDVHTARGLEFRLRDAAIQRKQFKDYARDCVLDEQDYQLSRGIQSPHMIRKAYMEASHMASQRAIEFGKRDADEIGRAHV